MVEERLAAHRGAPAVERDDRESRARPGNLRGKLLLIDGELDDNVLPHQSMRLVDALIDADADVDMLVVPGVEHTFQGRYHYVTRRTWDYLARHLHGTEPPTYRLAPFPSMPDWAVQPSG